MDTDANQPTVERRIRAAMMLAGLDFDALAERIDTPNYKVRTLRKIADEHELDRQARPVDLHLIGEACGVSDAFWTVDFSALEPPELREQIRALEGRFDQLAAHVAGEMARQARAMQVHFEKDHRAGGSEGGAR